MYLDGVILSVVHLLPVICSIVDIVFMTIKLYNSNLTVLQYWTTGYDTVM